MFELMQREQAQEVHVCRDPRRDFRAIIAIHSTHLGPALGGCRCLHYPDFESALNDVLRLARGMSYKAALAGLPLGGGKAVLLKPSGGWRRREAFEAFGDMVSNLGGRYITAVDSGSRTTDMDVVARRSCYVTSTSCSGDPSPWTARGVLEGMRVALKQRLGSDQLRDVTVAIQGLGQVGSILAQLLSEAGARLLLADRDPKRAAAAAKICGGQVLSPEQILTAPCEVFSPCALGGVLSSETIAGLQCAVVAGSANNQLAEAPCGGDLQRRGILYCPDYLINAGGLIHAALTYWGRGADELEVRLQGIPRRLAMIFEQAEAEQREPAFVAELQAEALLAAAANPKRRPAAA